MRPSSGSTAGVFHTGAPPSCQISLSCGHVSWPTRPARDRVERPHELAVSRVVRLHAPANAHLAAREAGDDEAVVVERRGRDRVALLPALGLDSTTRLCRCADRARRACRRAGRRTPCRRRSRRRGSSSRSTRTCSSGRGSRGTPRGSRRCRRSRRTRRWRPWRCRSRRDRRSAAPRPSTAAPIPSRSGACATRLSGARRCRD